MISLFGNKEIKRLQQQVIALQARHNIINYANSIQVSPTWDVINEIDAYKTIDDIYTVVTYLSEAAASVPFYAYKIVKDDAFKSYLKSGGVHKSYYRVKALEDLPEKNPTAQMLAAFTYSDKVAMYMSLFLNGELLFYKHKVDIGPRAGLVQLVQINPFFMTAVVSKGFGASIIGWKYSRDGYSTEFTADEIIQVKLNNPDPNSWRGLSPIKALAKRLTRLNAGLGVSTAQMQNGGLPGVIYEKDLGTRDLGKRREDFSKFLAREGNTGAPYWMDGEIGYIQTGTVLADMEVAELANIDFKKVCNVYKVPDVLFNNDKGAKYDNMEVAERRAYTTSIIPAVSRVRDAINEGLYLSARGEHVDYDISDIPAMADNMKNTADALNVMWWVTPNEKRQIQKFGVIEDELMDKVVIDSGKMLMDDLKLSDEPLDTTADYFGGDEGVEGDGESDTQ